MGDIDNTINVNFLKLKGAVLEEQLKIAKTIPFSKTNVQLKEYPIAEKKMGKDSICQLMQGMLACDLKNDLLMEVFYDQMIDAYVIDQSFGIMVYHGTYDIPAKATDGSMLGESEEVYDFLIVAFCPTTEEYDLLEPELGFLYPAFSDRSADPSRIQIFQKNPGQPEEGLLHKFL